jgi:hypothetical protein
MPPVDTVPAGSLPEAGTQGKGPRNQLNPADDLYKISVITNFVQIPVMVKDGPAAKRLHCPRKREATEAIVFHERSISVVSGDPH